MVTEIWVNNNIDSDNGLLPNGTKPLPEPMLTYHQWGLMAFTWGQFYRKCSMHLSILDMSLKITYKLSMITIISPRSQWVNPLTPTRLDNPPLWTRQAQTASNAVALQNYKTKTNSEISHQVLLFVCNKSAWRNRQQAILTHSLRPEQNAWFFADDIECIDLNETFIIILLYTSMYIQFIYGYFLCLW